MISREAPERPYGQRYYDGLRPGTRRSAAAVVPHLVDLLEPRSVVDVGCGRGTWLAALRARGVADILGLDGAWAGEAGLEIPAHAFRAVDLEQPVRLERTFDLVLCLEVAEHLPPTAAPTLVATLTRLGPVVVFSAAVPFQSGQGHINEQWPSYWSILFAGQDFICIDALRARFWQDPEIEVWYRQNLVVFARAGPNTDGISRAARRALLESTPLDLVHPDLYLKLVGQKAEWQRYTELLKLRVADLEDQLGRLRTSPLGRIQKILDRRPAWLRSNSSKAPRRAPATFEGPDGRS